MKKKSILIIGVFVLLVSVFIVYAITKGSWVCRDGEWIASGSPIFPKPEEACSDGKIESFDECVKSGYPVLEKYPSECRTKDQTFIQDIGNELEKSNLIRIDNPRPNQTIRSPLIIEGQARGYWFFEADFPIELYDGNNNLIAIAIAQAQEEWMTEDFVPFRAEMNFTTPTTEKGTLILHRHNPTGLPEHDDSLIVPVNFSKAEEMTIKVFFNNSRLDPDFSCDKVFSVERQIPKTQAVARAAIEELLKGTTPAEKNAGYLTNINSGVKIQRLTIENGIAKIDFDPMLEFQVGGSCRVTAIRAQITETLKQFPTVKDVLISIDGRTEDILQP